MNTNSARDEEKMVRDETLFVKSVPPNMLTNWKWKKCPDFKLSNKEDGATGPWDHGTTVHGIKWTWFASFLPLHALFPLLYTKEDRVSFVFFHLSILILLPFFIFPVIKTAFPFFLFLYICLFCCSVSYEWIWFFLSSSLSKNSGIFVSLFSTAYFFMEDSFMRKPGLAEASNTRMWIRHSLLDDELK